MADRGLKLIDGKELRSTDLTLPELTATITGDRLIQLVYSTVSSSLFGLTLPETLKSSALRRLNVVDEDTFSTKEFQADEASVVLRDMISAIADELKDDPLLVVNLDRKAIQMYLDDEDDFAMLAENLFTALDTQDTGKISKKEIRKALTFMGVENFSELSVVSEILKKHGADEEKQLGQAQFAVVLQPILQDLADALAEQHIVIIENVKIINGSKLNKLLANENLLNTTIEKILQECHEKKDVQGIHIIRNYLEKNGEELGLPGKAADDVVVAILYDSVFADVETQKQSSVLEKDDLKLLTREILGKFAQELESSPVYQDLDN